MSKENKHRNIKKSSYKMLSIPSDGTDVDFDKMQLEEEKRTIANTMRQIRSEAGKHRKNVAVRERKEKFSSKLQKIKSKMSAQSKMIFDSNDKVLFTSNGIKKRDIAGDQMTPSVKKLTHLIQSENPIFKEGKLWTPHRSMCVEKKLQKTTAFQIQTNYEPSGDQPSAISNLIEGVCSEKKTQLLLGVTGSGKTFTMAKVIEKIQRPTIVMAPNKILAAQLYSEFKNFFPNNSVEYFVSYYDYYQPEAYVPRTDTYIAKESSINEQIDRMRHSATRSLLERNDCIVVSSVSCIYGIGSVETYSQMTLQVNIGDEIEQKALLSSLVKQQYKREEMGIIRGSFRVCGDSIEVFPSHLENTAWRINMFGNDVETITEFDPITGKNIRNLQSIKIYANSHYVTPKPTLDDAIKCIKKELKYRIIELEKEGMLIEAQRLTQRINYDLEISL
ncbi:MAG: hypothetical protein C4617_02845 [Candidatus Liberibacter europaeus]|uniref:Helicase ATP-binding domain-containing protein n=1 Tax=Candidatus Liberibacter europaeus TaxID=744859 RepID=A0A2T4VYA6_9HYPH|nr:hypothetical protein [Candidatus Liberibacter europaeus]PTL86760.1 MAG: hypothetical protein C4617_02845 [Candidatus Liberibacter europaeus]